MSAQRELVFDGPDVTPADAKRLSHQHARVLKVMRGGHWLTLAEISKGTAWGKEPHERDPEPSVSARLRDLRKPRFGGYRIERRRRKVRGAQWEYRLVTP